MLILRGDEECFSSSEVGLVRICGVIGSENVDMSSDKVGENLTRRKFKVFWARFVLPGLVGS